MYGQGILKGLRVTFTHFINTYVDDIRYYGRKYYRQDNFEVRQGPKGQGAFVVQYPEEKIAVPERFRFVPFLVVENYDHPERPGQQWCTACGICSKVCPPQCIWIERAQDPDTGRPVTRPEAFFIDIDICMNCGFCAEFCPFDSIKMDHDYELASYDRTANHIFDLKKLSKEFRYWKSIAPTTAQEEMEVRGGWEHSDVIKERKKAERAAAKAKADAAKAEAAGDDAKPDTDADAAKAARLAKREAALARKREREAAENKDDADA
jgi:NADH-quinone oxidoreductase subunit I